jgi:hypothetical protein
MEEAYSNTSETDFYLDTAKPTYRGGYFQFWDAREYPQFGLLGEGLRTGQPQNVLTLSLSCSLHYFLRQK